MNSDEKLRMFEQWYAEKKYDVDYDLYQATGTPKEVLNLVLESKNKKCSATRWHQET